ncbi:MAG: RsmB/NOP family class I SAM-dependent RNA methyltransferase, partial [Gemmatimonadota bacterium]|nr:RsmB/NOP family class I SAM-dependent RNA methyltransferase [Gemmatimonadota bacterium]
MTLGRYRAFIDDWAAFLEAVTRPEPTVFRVRTGRITESALIERLEAQGHRVRPLTGLPGFFEVVSGPVPISMTVEHWLGLLYVQQASTGVAAPQLGPEPGERVLDLCSAPGGKTTHIAELMRDTGCLVASEISESRIRGLLGNVYKLGHTGIMVVAGDGREFPGGALFDRVLLDAPCTGEGTLRRRGGHLPEPSSGFIGHVTRAQRGLLERAVRLTRPGGTILYVTCTFAPEENEAVVSDALERLPVELEPLRLPVPHAPGLTHFGGQRYDARLEGAARIYPHHIDSGGLFLAKLVRLDDGEADPDAGWSPVPPIFPEVEADGTEAPAEPRDAADVQLLLDHGIAEVQERFDVRRPLKDFGWIMRGGRAWIHTLTEWPLASWVPGA